MFVLFLAGLVALHSICVNADRSPFEMINNPYYNNRVNDPDQVLTYTDYRSLQSLVDERSYLHSQKYTCGNKKSPLFVSVAITQKMKLSSAYPTGTDFARTLFNGMGLGDAACDNGILLFVSIEDRVMVIQQGKGISTSILSDAERQRITDSMKPYFKANDYGGGLVTGTSQLVETLTSNLNRQYWSSFGYQSINYLLTGFVVALFFFLFSV